ncbi:hypothetical protein D3C76_1496960 [compost metagenome]
MRLIGRPFARAVRIKLEWSTSIIEPRVIRAILAIYARDNATIGSIMYFGAPPFQPPPGSHFSVMANIITSNGATTKLGITTPVIAMPITE